MESMTVDFAFTQEQMKALQEECILTQTESYTPKGLTRKLCNMPLNLLQTKEFLECKESQFLLKFPISTL